MNNTVGVGYCTHYTPSGFVIFTDGFLIELASMTSAWIWSMRDQIGVCLTAWVTCNV